MRVRIGAMDEDTTCICGHDLHDHGLACRHCDCSHWLTADLLLAIEVLRGAPPELREWMAERLVSGNDEETLRLMEEIRQGRWWPGRLT